MTVRQTLQIGDPKLKAKNKPISDFSDPVIRQVIRDLTDTMHQNGLIGIAGPQIGENWQVFVTEPRETRVRPADQADELRVYINPKIIDFSNEESVIYEGCGSVVNGTLFGPVKRPRLVRVEAYDQHGQKFGLTCDGILARVIQHEYDHLLGIEFTEKICDYTKLMTVEFYRTTVVPDPAHINASKITIKEVTKV